MKSVFRSRPRASAAFNMAPMIDVVFLLIIFFVLVSTFASAEHTPLELPDPDDSAARNVRLKDRVIINVELADPEAPDSSDVVFSIGATRVESVARIGERLALQARLVPKLKVIVRADRRVRYGIVRQVMEEVAANGIERMNIAARVGVGTAPP